MKTALRLFVVLVVVLAALSTIALVGGLQWLSTQDTVRLIIDGEPVRLHIGQDMGWVAATAGIAMAMLLVFLIVPLVVLLALVFSAAAAVLSLAAALSPLLLLGVLAWWIVKRNSPSASNGPPTAASTPPQNS